MKWCLSILTSVILVLIGTTVYWFWPQSAEPSLTLKSVPFQDLPGWQDSDPRKAMIALNYSCKALLHMPQNKAIGTSLIPLAAQDLWPACQELAAYPTPTKETARKFFERYFAPILIEKSHNQVKGLFTGYYMPLLKAAKSKSKIYSAPLYGVPNDLVSANLNLFDTQCQSKIIGRVADHRLVPYFTRAEIESGAIKGKAEILAWVESPLERLILEIEGSGVLVYANGEKQYIGHATQNGRHYLSLPQLMIQKGYFEKKDASYSRIRKFFKTHPELVKPLLNQNESFVFFRILKTNQVVGSEGVPLTPGISMAVDLHYIPLGLPLWLNTQYYSTAVEAYEKLERLMIAQDTGGAIRGPVRGDFFWGEGSRAVQNAGQMQSEGTYWVLLPRKHITR